MHTGLHRGLPGFYQRVTLGVPDRDLPVILCFEYWVFESCREPFWVIALSYVRQDEAKTPRS